ncbi:MAG: UrcA family protein [Sphingomonas bacterium]|nr:UrcA family protein [Sphingomonas bacterium]
MAIIVGCAALMATDAKAQSSWLDFQPVNQQGVRQASVKYADLDLNREAGREVLWRRIGHALKMVCRADDRSRALVDLEGECRRAKRVEVEQTVAQVIANRRAAGQIAQLELGARR